LPRPPWRARRRDGFREAAALVTDAAQHASGAVPLGRPRSQFGVGRFSPVAPRFGAAERRSRSGNSQLYRSYFLLVLIIEHAAPLRALRRPRRFPGSDRPYPFRPVPAGTVPGVPSLRTDCVRPPGGPVKRLLSVALAALTLAAVLGGPVDGHAGGRL